MLKIIFDLLAKLAHEISFLLLENNLRRRVISSMFFRSDDRCFLNTESMNCMRNVNLSMQCKLIRPFNIKGLVEMVILFNHRHRVTLFSLLLILRPSLVW